MAALAVVVALGVEVRLTRRLWFFGDDWQFLLGRSLTHDPVHALFTPHNEHWSTVPVLLYRTTYAVVGLHHYLPYAVLVLLAHAVVCLMVWVLTRRAGAAPWASAATVVVVAFLGAGSEDLLWDFQIGFVGSVAFGLVAVWAADHHGSRRWDVVAIVAMVLSFASSGMGAVAWVLFTALALARRGRRAAIVLTGVPAAVFVLWFVTFGRTGLTQDKTPRSAYLQLPEFVWRGLTQAWGSASGIPDAGPTIVVLVLAGTVLLTVRRPPTVPADLRVLAAAGVGTAAFLYLFVGLTRVRLGVEQAEVSRYAYIAVVAGSFALAAAFTAVLPASLTAAARGSRTSDRWTVGVALGAVLGLVTVSGVFQLTGFASSRVALIAPIRPQVLGAVVLAREGVPVLSDKAEPMYTPDVSMSALRSSEVQDAFGDVETTPQGLLDARAAVQTDTTSGDPKFPAAASLTWNGVSGPAPATTGCTSGDAVAGATVNMVSGADGRAAFRLLGTAPTVKVVLLAGGLTSTAVLRPVAPDGTWIATVAPDATVRVIVQQPGRITVCGEGGS